MHFPRPSVFAAARFARVSSTAAFALDHPSSGTKLQLTSKNGKQKLVFLTKDPGFLFSATVVSGSCRCP